MRKEIKVNAPAKVNLFLEVTGKREDGYHELDTVMQLVGLCDEVSVSFDPENEGIALTCQKKYIPTDENNIAYRCARTFLLETGIKGGVNIHIEKRIPVAAGLGGGSADGAAVLKALNILTGVGKSTEELCEIGKKLGADIPFCIRGGCARARGIGEIFSPSPVLRGFTPVIAIGSHGSSTPAAYKALDDIGYRGTKNAEKMIAALESGRRENVVPELYNAFEEVVPESVPEVDELKKLFLEYGAAGSLMSGSGASVFGLFERTSLARAACRNLRAAGYFAVVAPVLRVKED